jgi:uncharacterized protein YbbC (DUF1343 family)
MSMMKFKLNTPFVGIDGKNLTVKNFDFRIPVETQGQLLAVLLTEVPNTFEQVSSLKGREWADNLYKNGTLEIDKEDLKTLTNGIEDCMRKGVSRSVISSLRESLDESKNLNKNVQETKSAKK